MIPAPDDGVVRRIFRMQIHMVLRMCREISAVIPRRHRIQGQPAVLRLPDMTDHRYIVLLQVIEYRIENWIVDHYKTPILVLDRHADILPDLDTYRPAINRPPQIGHLP